jgi:hypothetical protein
LGNENGFPSSLGLAPIVSFLRDYQIALRKPLPQVGFSHLRQGTLLPAWASVSALPFDDQAAPGT